jgi:hypothetical protein
MARPYFANPMFSQGLSNLAEALFPSDAERLQMANLGRQGKLIEAQRRKFESDALSGEIRNRETEAMLAAEAAQTEQLIAGLGLDPRVSGAVSGMRREGIVGGNAQQSGAGIEALMSVIGAFGTEDQRRSARILQGGALDQNFAGTTQRADAVSGRNATEERRLQGVKEAGMTQRNRADNATSRYNNAYDAVMDFMGDQMPGGAAGAGGGRATTPLTVGGNDAKAIDQILGTLVGSVPTSNPGELDQATLQQLRVRTAELYQQNRNLPAAVQQAWNEIMGQGVAVENQGDWNPLARDRSVIRPSTPAAVATAPQTGAPRVRRFNPQTGRIE